MPSDETLINILTEQLCSWAEVLRTISLVSVSIVEEDKFQIILTTDGRKFEILIYPDHVNLLRDGSIEVADVLNAFLPDLEKSFAEDFYNSHYQRLFLTDFLLPVSLISSTPGICRYCKMGFPDVQFTSEAHAIPESTGNKTLFTGYECDKCNNNFGAGIERNFISWLAPLRTMAAIKGKNGTSALKTKDVEIDPSSGVIKIVLGKKDRFVVSDDRMSAQLRVNVPSFTPFAVIKALLKMALSVMPEEEVPFFKKTLAWVCDKPHQQSTSLLYKSVTYSYTPYVEVSPYCVLLRRRGQDNAVPYMTFILCFANLCIQIFLRPDFEQDDIERNFMPWGCLHAPKDGIVKHGQTEDMNSGVRNKTNVQVFTITATAPMELKPVPIS